MHKYFKNSLQALVAFPVIATTLVSPFSGTSLGSPTAAVISPDTNRPLTSQIAVNQQSNDLEAKAQKIDAYLAQRNSPMVGQGKKFVLAAEKNDLPWPLIASMSVIESGAGNEACPGNKYNVFGWGSCHGEKFDSYDDAIDTVAKAVAGNSDTTKRYYDGKSLPDILETYNGRANSHYVENTMWVMNQIEQQPIATNSSDSANS